ncbi:hypothetical protein PLUTE_a6022 [Pseudoalteromonas luteoviolacea DSM 6061]|nr:hypothetical protein [Pseudoalteromonas luteoviolacea DSM 6061]
MSVTSALKYPNAIRAFIWHLTNMSQFYFSTFIC